MADPKPIKIDLSKSRRARLSEVTEKVHAEYGNIGVGRRMTLDLRRIPTGSFMLDYAMGGGVPEGRITMFKGAKGSGKTTHAIRTVATAQSLCRRCMRKAKITDVVACDSDGEMLSEETLKEYEENGIEPDHWMAVGECDCIKEGLVPLPHQEKGESASDFHDRSSALLENSYEEYIVAWVDMEMVFDWKWAIRLGVDDRRLLFSRPETAEEAVDTLDPLLRSGAVDLLVIDSIAHFTPSVEVEETMYKQQQGVMARLVNKGVRKFVSALAACANEFGRVPTQIWINQERDKLGPFPGKVTPGGKGQGFATSIELNCWSGKKEVQKINAGNKGEEIIVPQWENLHFKCTKNKTAPPYVEGFYTQILTDVDSRMGQIDEAAQLFRYAAHFGLLTKEKNKYTYSPTGYETTTQKDMRAHLDEHMDDLKMRLMNLLLLREG